MEFVTVRHPDIEGTAEVSRAAFDVAYAEKGWQIVDDAAAGSLPDGVTVVPTGPPAPPTKRSAPKNPEA